MIAVWWTCLIPGRVCILSVRHGRLGAIDWADKLAILTLDACHVQTPLQNGKTGAQSDSHILTNDGLPVTQSGDSLLCWGLLVDAWRTRPLRMSRSNKQD